MLDTNVDLTTAFYSLKPPRQGSNLPASSLEILQEAGIGEAECEALCQNAELLHLVRGWRNLSSPVRALILHAISIEQ